jgi:hypothetical protein
MCGIVGYISAKQDTSYKAEKEHFMRFALALDTLRGFDSTGVMTLRRKFKVDVMKTTMPGDKFVHSPKYLKTWKPGWTQFGHNRAATVGKVNVNNAHPFTDGPITLVHNGTLYAAGSTLPVYNKKLDVDSMQVAHNFAAYKPEDAKHVLEKIDGAYALVWYDKRDRSVNVARNSERPLHFGLSRNKDLLWFMSDGSHLNAVNNSFGSGQCGASNIYKLDIGKHLKWKQGSLVPEVTTFVPFSRVVTRGYGTAYNTGRDHTPLQKAVSKWTGHVDKCAGTKKPLIGSENPLIKLGGQQRSIPRPMIKALMSEYDLTPKDKCRFVPRKASRLANNEWMITGTIEHPEWESELPAVMYDGKLIHTTAYMQKEWVVQPLGLAHPWDKTMKGCPGVMVRILSTDWMAFDETRNPSRPKASDGKSDYHPSTYVNGPGGLLVPYAKVFPIMEGGCISCGYVLTVKGLESCTFVNGSRDIICKNCTDELSGGSYQ